MFGLIGGAWVALTAQRNIARIQHSSFHFGIAERCAIVYCTIDIAMLLAKSADRWFATIGLVVGAVALFAFFIGLKSIAQGSFGKGDVLLAPLVGFALAHNSWGALLGGVVGIFLIGGVVSAALLFTGRVSRKSRIAFGPYIVVGTLLALVI